MGLALGLVVLGLLGMMFRGRLADLGERLVYFPYRTLEAQPSDLGMEFEDLKIATSDGEVLHAWFLPGEGPGLLFLHGNGGNISHRLEKVARLKALGDPAILLLDYRGYGQSTGRPGHKGLAQDAKAALRVLRKKTGKQSALVYGESLGAAVAVGLAAESSVDGLILEGAFTSLSDMAREHYAWIPGAGSLMKGRFESETKITQIKVPLLILHATRDEVVPLKFASRLLQAAGTPPDKKKLVLIKNGSHNDLMEVGGQFYDKTLAEFFGSINFLGRMGPSTRLGAER